MSILRMVLMIANATLCAWFAYLFVTNLPEIRAHALDTETVGAIAVFAFLGLNFIYLLGTTRQWKLNWRIARLVRLWFDAKESELRRRADQNQK